MTEKAEFLLACEKKLDRLKKEEVFILSLLKDVQKQLGKYKVEALHMLHVDAVDEDEKRSEGEDDDGINEEELSKYKSMFERKEESTDEINRNKLDLDLNIMDDEEFEESDESD